MQLVAEVLVVPELLSLVPTVPVQQLSWRHPWSLQVLSRGPGVFLSPLLMSGVGEGAVSRRQSGMGAG